MVLPLRYCRAQAIASPTIEPWRGNDDTQRPQSTLGHLTLKKALPAPSHVNSVVET